MTAGESPVAFLSYTRADDEHEGGLISAFRERLQGEVQFLSGDNTFSIFQDRINIKWGQDWRTRIAESLDNAVFLIPVITSRFFKSEACCEELDCFLHRERSLGRRDLVLPLYYGTAQHSIILQSGGKTLTRRQSQATNTETGATCDLPPSAHRRYGGGSAN